LRFAVRQHAPHFSLPPPPRSEFLDTHAKRVFAVLRPLRVTLINVPDDWAVDVEAPDFPRCAVGGWGEGQRWMRPGYLQRRFYSSCPHLLPHLPACLPGRDKALGSHRLSISRTVFIERDDFRDADSPDYFGLAPGEAAGGAPESGGGSGLLRTRAG